MSVTFSDNVAYLEGSQAAVWFAMDSNGFVPSTGTAAPVKELMGALELAPWGEDNRFPQNIVNLMDYCGIGKAALDLKARSLWGQGIIPGKITGYENGGNTEIFEPLDRLKYKNIYQFIESRWFFRYQLEFLQDWTWFANCFPEMIFSNDGKTITNIVHQESCDCRFKQMNAEGQIKNMYLSKLWGMAEDQYVKFDPKNRVKGIISNPQVISEVDGKFVKQLDVIDMYNALQSAQSIAAGFKSKKGLKSAILPVNYPSPNKTYYQLATWDGARLSGWIEIAAKVPAMFKALYNKAFNIKYHIKIPWLYFEKKYGAKWKETEKDLEARKALVMNELKDMDKFLAGSDKAYTSFISMFQVDDMNKKDYAKIEIDTVESKNQSEKDLIASQAANVEILGAMGVNPRQTGMGAVGGPYGGADGGGSSIREAKLVYDANLNLERQVILEPLYLVRDFNREIGGQTEWENDIVFRFRDTVLTTLDKGTGTQKKVS